MAFQRHRVFVSSLARGSFLRLAAVPILVTAPTLLVVNCSGGSSGSGGSAQQAGLQITEPTNFAPDPARQRVFVGDRTRARLFVVDPADLAVTATVLLPDLPGGVALPPDGSKVIVSLPARRSLLILEPFTFTTVEEHGVPFAPQAIVSPHPNQVLAASDAGLSKVEFVPGRVETLADEVRARAVLHLDAPHQRAFAAQDEAGTLRIFSIALDGMSDSIDDSLPDSHPGAPVALATSFDGTRLYVGSHADDSLTILDPLTLALLGETAVADGLVAMAVNRIATRIYLAGGTMEAEGLELSRLHAAGRVAVPRPIERRGIAVDSTSAWLLTLLDDGTLRSAPLFALLLRGEPQVPAGEPYHLELQGTPDTPFELFVAAGPGYLFLDPPDTPDRRFLDLDPTTLRLILADRTDAAGSFARDYEVAPPGSPSTSIVLQAVAYDTAGGIKAVSNPLLLRIE